MAEIPTITFPMVISTGWGGYNLTLEAQAEVARRKRLTTTEIDGYLIVGDGYDDVAHVVPRNDPDLVAVVREMGARAGKDLKVIEVSVGVEIQNNDGKETIHVYGGEYR